MERATGAAQRAAFLGCFFPAGSKQESARQERSQPRRRQPGASGRLTREPRPHLPSPQLPCVEPEARQQEKRGKVGGESTREKKTLAFGVGRWQARGVGAHGWLDTHPGQTS